jgi:ribonuclease HII
MLLPSLELENKLWSKGYNYIVGIDEVGRGCLAGPVITAAVLIPRHCELLPKVNDSKKLSLKLREKLYLDIQTQAIDIKIGAASVREIEKINILNASYLAMQRALKRIYKCDHALIDGLDTHKFDFGTHTAVIGGDGLSYAIACASIIAKVTRDRLMRNLAKHYPGYAWETNMGYGTKAHLQGLETLGITPFHRRTYKPIQNLLK